VAVFDPDSDLVTAPVIAGAPDEPVLRVDDIQGNVMPGFATFVQVLVGVRFDDGAAARRWLSWLTPTISTLRQVNDVRNLRRRAARSDLPRPPTPILTNVALSAEGLRLLGLPTDRIRDDPFRTGMDAATSVALGDPREPADEGHASNWILGGRPERTPHALVLVAADEGRWVDSRVREIRAALVDAAGSSSGDGSQPGAAEVVYTDRGEVIADAPGDLGREHFGFRDGISTIAPRGRLSSLPRHFLSRRYIDPYDPRALRFARPGQPLVWPGQFVFGYPSQPDTEPGIEPGPEADGGYPWMVDGSFLVVRRLRQDVEAFLEDVANESARIRRMPGCEWITADRLATMLVGRWPNGTAAAVDPDEPDPSPMADRLRVNHFGYASAAGEIRVCADPHIATEDIAARDEFRVVEGAPEDPTGTRCPTFAHVRKVNPRDQVTDQGSPAITLRAQVLRRGITFGPSYPRDDPVAQASDDGQRGLLFLAYQTSIESQFELLSRKWMNRPNAPEPGSGHDLLVGQETRSARRATLRIPGVAPVELSFERSWVIPTGGGYFFSPSIATLVAMAHGRLG
jgi:Dyp-type peroxidase family